jgi:hypothetical protein
MKPCPFILIMQVVSWFLVLSRLIPGIKTRPFILYHHPINRYVVDESGKPVEGATVLIQTKKDLPQQTLTQLHLFSHTDKQPVTISALEGEVITVLLRKI